MNINPRRFQLGHLSWRGSLKWSTCSYYTSYAVLESWSLLSSQERKSGEFMGPNFSLGDGLISEHSVLH